MWTPQKSKLQIQKIEFSDAITRKMHFQGIYAASQPAWACKKFNFDNIYQDEPNTTKKNHKLLSLTYN